MRTPTSLPDDVLQQIQRLARRRTVSRGALYREAAAGYLLRARAAILGALYGAAPGSVVIPPP